MHLRLALRVHIEADDIYFSCGKKIWCREPLKIVERGGLDGNFIWVGGVHVEYVSNVKYDSNRKQFLQVN